jgi:phenylpropionate dioxygenase-like ring-hydroxylating dioxygenase large terminal subunit
MEIKSLIDPEGGLVNRRIFADREIYELEREHLFARCWLYLGHESEVPIPATSSPRTWEKSRSSCAEI